MSQNKQVNLFIALGEFIEEMRSFISTELHRKYGDSWDRKYFEKLHQDLHKAWGKNLQEGIAPFYLIDFGNLNSFAIGAKNDFFPEFFGYKKSQNLPTIFNELAEVRNAITHYLPLDDDKAEKAYLHMIELAKTLEYSTLEVSLRRLKELSFGSNQVPPPGPKPKKSIQKSTALDLVNNTIGSQQLSGRNTVFSNIIDSKSWWLNIPPAKFLSTLNILLVEIDQLIWIVLPRDTCIPPEEFFSVRKDNGKIDIRIGIEGNDYLKDYLNQKNFDFSPFVRSRIDVPSMA